MAGRHVPPSDFGEVGTWRRMLGASTELLILQLTPMTEHMHGQPVMVPPWRARLLDEARSWLLTPWHHNTPGARRRRGLRAAAGRLLRECRPGARL